MSFSRLITCNSGIEKFNNGMHKVDKTFFQIKDFSMRVTADDVNLVTNP